MKRTLALLLALMMALSVIGCGEKSGAKFTDGKIKEGVCYDITGISPDATVMTVDGTALPMDLYFYNLTYSASYMENFMSMYGMTLDWDMELNDGQTVRDVVKADAMETTQYTAVLETMAREKNVVLGEEELAELEEVINDSIEQLGGKDKYLETLASYGLSEETYNSLIRMEILFDAVKAAYAEAPDSEIAEIAGELDYVTADHILISTMDESGAPLDEAAAAEKKALAEDILAQLKNGADFASLADEYSEDPGRATNPDGYTFGKGQMVAEFEEAAFELDEGELSDIVETSYGYHILLRKPLDIDAMRGVFFEPYVSLRTQDAKIEVAPALDTLDVQKVYEAFNEHMKEVSATEDVQDVTPEG